MLASASIQTLGSTTTLMGSSNAKNTPSQGLPRVIVVAVVLWLLGAILRVVPVQALLAVSPGSGPRSYFMRFYPGWELVLPLQVLLAVFLLRCHAWSRYSVATLVVGLLLAHSSESFGPLLHNFPLATARNAMVVALQITTVVLLFLPSANRWFSMRGEPSAA
jgi:hypothetical protein